MGLLRGLAWTVLGLTALAALGAAQIAPAPYEKQFRESPNSQPCRQFPLGTDELGRDRLSRLLYGTRISLLLAPAAALLATLIAAFAGIAAGMIGGRLEQLILSCVDLVASLPWLFLLIAVRALLPLNVSAYASVGVTFLLLGALGWASSARKHPRTHHPVVGLLRRAHSFETPVTMLQDADSAPATPCQRLYCPLTTRYR